MGLAFFKEKEAADLSCPTRTDIAAFESVVRNPFRRQFVCRSCRGEEKLFPKFLLMHPWPRGGGCNWRLGGARVWGYLPWGERLRLSDGDRL